MSADLPALVEGDKAALIERLRQSGLRLDREGHWWHEGSRVAHAGLASALHRWLDRLDDGRYVVRLDRARYAYVEVEDAPVVVRSVDLDPGGDGPVTLRLSNERTEELDYGTLRVGQGNALYCQVAGRLPARFSRPAYYLLSPRIEQGPGGFLLLAAAGKRWPIEIDPAEG